MKTLKTLILLLFMLVFTNINAQVSDDLKSAIGSGNAREIAKYLNSSVDMTLVNHEEVYSKAHAEAVLRDFFSKNAPRNFSILHQGASKEGAKFAIGQLVTSQGNFRTYIFMKSSGNAMLIHELRFEKE